MGGEGGGGDVQAVAQVADGQAFGAGLDQLAVSRQAGGVAEGI